MKKSIPANVPSKKPSEYFGELVFDRDKMRKYLDAKTLSSLVNCIDKTESLDLKIADAVAKGATGVICEEIPQNLCSAQNDNDGKVEFEFLNER